MKLFFAIIIMSFTFVKINAQSTWVAPASANSIKNPTVDKVASAKRGEIIFKQICMLCHGMKGKGDGVAGLTLKPKPADFTSAKVQSETDGSLFWKLTNGNSPMASYKDIYSESQRWDLINYIRTLK